MATFAHPPAPPSPFTFTAVEPSYAVYGWKVSIDRRALELSTLKRAGARGFALSGSGVATVTTARLFRRGRAYEVTESGAFGTERRRQLASSDGRLRVRVPLGPANPVQELWELRRRRYPLPSTRVYSSRVAIAASAPGHHATGRSRTHRRPQPRFTG